MTAASQPRRSLRLLLVEDSPDDAELLGFALRNAPFSFSLQRVDTEAAFRTALAASPAPDVVLCDYHLPRFSMARALEIVRSEMRSDTPFIVVSRLIGEDAAVEAMQRGANDYLLKGRLGRLANAIVGTVERNEAQRERERAEEELRRSDVLNRSLLNSISMRIAVLDGQGRILAANGAWLRQQDDHAAGTPAPAVGENLLEHLARRDRESGITGMREGIEAVMRRREPRFALEHEIAARGGMRWEMLRAEPLADSEHGAVVSIEDITPRMLTHLALHDAHRRLQKLSQRVLMVQEEERRAIALELHDDLGQSLAAQKIALHNLVQPLAGTPQERPLRQCLEIADDLLEKLRRLAYSLRPPQLDQFGIEGALKALARSQAEATGISVECRVVGLDARPPAVVESACYRIAQEALNNATRHGKAGEVMLEVEMKDGILRLTVRDDGCGFVEEEARARAMRTGRLGLIGMAERAQLANGQLKVRSSPGAGTFVTATFALEGAAEPAP